MMNEFQFYAEVFPYCPHGGTRGTWYRWYMVQMVHGTDGTWYKWYIYNFEMVMKELDTTLTPVKSSTTFS